MSSNSWWQTLITAQVDGSALTAAAAASALPAAARFTFPASLLKIGDAFRITASGRISNIATTPGTARFDVRFGSSVVFDSQAMTLTTTAETNVPWWLDITLTCRTIGATSAATLFGMGVFASTSLPLSGTATATNGVLALPTSGTIQAGAGFDSTVSNVVDLFFTQTVATGSMTLHTFNLTYCT